MPHIRLDRGALKPSFAGRPTPPSSSTKAASIMSTSSPILPSNGKYDGTKKKPSLFERIRSRGSKKRSEADKRDSTPSPPSSSSTRGETEPEDSRVVTPMIPSKAGEVQLRKKSKFPHRDQITIDKAPTARESAFSGPPRYDWIDIVSNVLCIHLIVM